MALPANQPTARVLAAFVVLALAVSTAGKPARAQTPVGNITEIIIEGNDSISTEKILGALKSRVGRPLDTRVVEDDLQALVNTHWFSGEPKQSYKPDPARNGFIYIIEVREMPILREVEFRGMTKLKRKEIEENTGIKVCARADAAKTIMARESIQRLYEEKGYDFAQVRILEGNKPNSTKAIFEVFEGPKCKVVGVDFEGNHYVSAGVLATKINCGPRLKGLWPKKFNDEDLRADVKALTKYYDEQGFLKVQISVVKRPDADQGSVRITFVIYEDVQFKVRSIRFENNEKLPTVKLMEDMKLQKGAPYSENLREMDEKTLKSKYGVLGYIDAHIECKREYLQEPGMLDLVYSLDEGNPYDIGRIIIRGNGRTQFRVILREFNMAGLVPGQPLDSNRLDTAKKRLMNLRYFQSTPDQGGRPLDIKYANQRAGDRPYDGLAPITPQDSVQRARLQSPGPDAERSGVRLAQQLPDGPPALDEPGAPPAAAAPGVAEPPPGFELPAVVAPAPDGAPAAPAQPALPPALPNARGVRTPPLGAGEPAGSSNPSIPGMNMTDVGPDRQEPFANRSFADIITSVDEMATGNLMFAVGATSYGGLTGSLILHEGNFDYKAVPRSMGELFSGNAFRGAGQDLRIQLSPGTKINIIDVAFRNPYLFDLPIGFNASGYTLKRFYPDWTESRTGFRMGLGKQFGTRVYADVAVRIEDVGIFGYRVPAPAELLAASGHTTLASLRPTLRFDNRNDPFAASAGQYVEFAFEQYWGTFTAPKVTLEARQYLTLGSRPDGTGKRFMTFRSFFGVTGQDTPIYERFFAGDFRSMRGFSYRGVGPRELGVGVGGVLEALGSVEYQFPWTANDKLQQVVFCDFGTVESSYTLGQFRAAVGTGLRIYLPRQMFGPLPLCFDLAFPVAKQHEDHVRYFTFFIGGMF